MRGFASKRLQNIASSFLFSVEKKFKYKFAFGSHMIPHPQKAYKGGEDAMYTSDNLLVVADGVGGWADQGVDPGLYSKKLCEIIGKKIQKSNDKYIDNPQQLLVDAVKQNREIGSTTVCILSLNPQSGKLLAYYLGDSVYAFFKDSLVQVADQQQKSFNFPYQVGSVGDDPEHGILHEHLADNLLDRTIVIASDGLWDNYDAESILKDVTDNRNNDLKRLAQTIAQNSFKHSLLQNYASPFYKKALAHKLRTYKTGKPDDITVVTARIVKQEIA